MSNRKYFLIQGIYTIDDQKYIGYGIEYRDCYQIITFEDVSLNLPKISFLVELCNSFALSPEHLCDIIEDFLADIA